MANFRTLAVWQRARVLILDVYRETNRFPTDERFGLTSQIRRSAVSVCSNLAEGCGRGGDTEFRRFVRIARGSVKELECQLLLARDLEYLSNDRWDHLNAETRLIAAMLTNLGYSLVPGPRPESSDS